jgi:DNA-binding CsgD family transcriptional regulator
MTQTHDLTPVEVAVHRLGRMSATEERMALLVQQGLRNRQIAEILHYSPRSVDVYLSRIYAKLGISSRLELARALDAAARPEVSS